MDIFSINLEQIYIDREIGLKNKDYNLLRDCAISMAQAFPTSRLYAQEAAFFLGRTNDRQLFESIIYGPTLKLPPSLRQPRSFQTEEKLFEIGKKYPFLDDTELNFLEELYCSSNTYDMTSRMLYDGDDLLRRKLARFNKEDFNIHHDSFSRKLCLDIIEALIKNETELDVQEALDSRHQSFDDMVVEANLYGFTPNLKYDPILVYDRRSNTIQTDETDLSDRFLCPISNFSWAGIKLSNAIDLYIETFGVSVKDDIIYPALEKCGLSKQTYTYAAFNAYWFCAIEKAFVETKSLSISDSRLLNIREKIARKWLEYQNQKNLH